MAKTHLAFASESVNNASLDNIAFRPDEKLGLAAAGDEALLPEELMALALAYFGGSGMTQARVSTSFLENGLVPRPYFAPLDSGAPGDLPPFHDFRDNPFPLHDPKSKIQGKLKAHIANGGAAQSRALLLLSDGPLKPADLRGVIPVRFTGSLTTAAAETFEGFTPTLAEALADGIWELVDARVQGATALAWRVVPPSVGKNDPSLRPGWLAQTTDAQKRGLPIGALNLGVQFKSDALPTIQLAASSAAVQSPKGVLYLRRVS